jgi:beta-galactosidase
VKNITNHILFFIIIPTLIIHASGLALGIGGTSSRTSFNKEWLFARFANMPDGAFKEEPTGLEATDFVDTLWRKLDLPHDWGIEGPFRMDLPNSTGKLPWSGIGWYRKHFNVSPSEKGNLFFIDFDGAMSHTKIWLNGKYIGEWPYGYASFRFDITPYIRFTEENVIAVRLDNPPNSSRWYPGGGIYRNVWLVKTAPVHIAHWGNFVTTPNITEKSSAVHVETKVDNQTNDAVDITVQVKISECGNSAVIASTKRNKLRIPANKTAKCEVEADIRFPKLWSLESPNLYCAKVFLQQKGIAVDSATTIFGIRRAVFTPDIGFVLNGKRIQINGVCNHHDLGLLGTAVNVRALERQIELLQEMGCNAIRTSHNPPAPELLNLCDQMGMLVIDEAFDCWEQGKTPNDYSLLFKEWHEKDIRAFVRRDRNHPSVIAWSSGNEVREQGDGRLSKKLKEIFQSEDPTRPVTAGCDKLDAGFNGFQNSVDIFGYNYKPYMYKKFREENPEIPIYGSETASCVSTNGEYFFPVSGDKSNSVNNNQVGSYDLYTPWWANIPDVEFEGQDKNPFLAGEFVWTGFDYLGEPTPFFGDTSVSRSSYFGIMDLCGFKKDRFYLYQSRWRPDFPVAHILPHWNWPNRVGKITPVHVYTSGDEAELFLNSKSLGRKKKDLYKYRLRWDDVKYETGELKVIAYKNGKQWAMDIVKTTGPAAKLELTVDRSMIDADGRDLAFITVKILDKDGLKVPTANNLIYFKVRGCGVIAAVGNGDPTNHNSFQSEQYNAFHGQCILIIRSVEGKSGPIEVKAESEALEDGNILIISK